MKKKSLPNKTQIEFSKILCLIAVIIFAGVGIFTICDYYSLVRLAITTQSSVGPDASLPIASITSILGVLLSYCVYQFGLKNSRNKYGVDSDGQPFQQAVNSYKSVEEEKENNN